MVRPPPALLPLLIPLSWIYRAGAALRNRMLDSGTPARLGLPVISVGNLTVGGAGKTPFVEACARILLEAGLRPAILSRGYGRTSRGPLLVSEGSGVLPLAPWTEAGDEPLLLARLVPEAVVAVAERREAAGRILEERDDLGIDVFLLDDGFQHRLLHRDLDLVLVRADDPFGNGRLLPAGPLREPLSALRRASAVVLTACPDPGVTEVGRLEDRLREAAGRDLPVLHARLAVEGLRSAGGERAGGSRDLKGARVAAFCGLAGPAAFRRTLEGLGAEVVLFRSFRDHHPYTREEFKGLWNAAREAGAELLVTTEKDAVRLAGISIPFTPLSFRVLAVRSRPHEPDRLRELLLAAARR